jgi:hypothetical protein
VNNLKMENTNMKQFNRLGLVLLITMGACGDGDGSTDNNPDALAGTGGIVGTSTQGGNGGVTNGGNIAGGNGGTSSLPTDAAMAMPDSGVVSDSGVVKADTGGPVVPALNLPPGLGLALWLDGDAPASLTINNAMEVTAWHDRRANVNIEVTPTAATTRPAFQATGRNGRGALLFDGDTDQLAASGFTGLSGTDFEIVFAGEPIVLSAPNALVGALSGTSDWAVMLDQHASNDVRLTYRRPPGTTGGASAVADRTALVRPMYVTATHQSSGDIDTLGVFSADEPKEATGLYAFPNPSAGIGAPLNLRIGRTQDGHMHGKIYEILIYTRRLSVSERAEVTAYLRTKWNLP